VGEQLKYVPAEKIAYFYFEDGYAHLCTYDDKKLVLDFSLDQLNDMLNPKEFFRVSRKLIINHKAIDKIHSWARRNFSRKETRSGPGISTRSITSSNIF